MKKSVYLVAMSLLLSAMVISCGQKNPFPGYTPTETGLYYKQIVKGDGEALKMNDVIKMDLAYYINDSLLFTTNVFPEPAYDLIRESIFQGDIYEGFRLMHVGDSMSFMISADSAFLKQFRAHEMPSYIKPGSFLRWEVRVDDAMTEEEFQQMKMDEMATLQQQADAELAAYLEENNIKAEPQESGLIYVSTKKGKGPKPGYKQMVKVHYTGRLLDGTVFDSSVERGEPIEFQLGVGQVIPGWDEGIALMSKGEKGILYIPSNLAYGSRQAGELIKPYSNLVFEVELVDFYSMEEK